MQDITAIGGTDQWLDAPEPPESPETICIIMKDGKVYKNAL